MILAMRVNKYPTLMKQCALHSALIVMTANAARSREKLDSRPVWRTDRLR